MKPAESSNTFQLNQYDCGIAATLTVLKFHGINADVNLVREYTGTNKSGSTLLGLQQTFKKFGFTAKAYTASLQDLSSSTFPAILHVEVDGTLHYIVLHEIDYKEKKCLIYDPRDSDQKSRILSFDSLNEIWKSKIILLVQVNTDNEQTQNRLQESPPTSQFKSWALEKLHDDYGILILIATTSLLVGLLAIAFPVLIQLIIDHVTKEENSPISLLFIILIALLGRSGISYVRDVLIAHQSKDFSIRLVSTFFKRTLKFPKSFFDSKSVGDLVSRINDSRKIQSVINYVSGKLIVDVVSAVASLVFLFYYSFQIGLVTLAGLLLWSFITYFKTLRIVREQELTLRSYSVSESAFIDSITGYIDIKITQAERLFSDSIITTYRTYQENNFNLKMTYASLQVFTSLASSVVLCLVIYMSIQNTLSGLFTVGELVAVYQIAGISFGSFSGLITGNIFFQESKVVMQRLYEYESLACSYKSKDEENYTKNNNIIDFSSISFSDISFNYPGRSSILKNVNLEIKKGEIALLYGDNGTGKSTVGMLITRLITPASGNILINNKHPYKDRDKSQIRSEVGILIQNAHIFNTSIYRNIFLDSSTESSTNIYNELHKQIIDDIGLSDLISDLPNGIHTIIGDGGIPLSGGQMQMICILRLLLSDKQVLIFDEPTTALDQATIKKFFKLIRQIEDKIILVVSHRRELSKYADKVFELKDRTIINSSVNLAVDESRLV